MTEINRFDVLIIGAGQAGIPLARDLAKADKRVALVEENAELVHMYVDLMNADLPYTVIRDAIHIHPTLAEAVQSVLTSLN